MNTENIITIVSVILNIGLLIYGWKEKSRIKAKEECWNKDTQSIVNVAAGMQERIRKNEIQSAKELQEGILAIGAFANGMHVGLKEELKLKE
ncbi:MAG: hypothetical protein LiPW39_387 [Parcubacteria group bacterium LiPW_39]|nr:MAG: hypothetical protein LiPW39_387 [Parcubacteria group bacterium LiPW_39]